MAEGEQLVLRTVEEVNALNELLVKPEAGGYCDSPIIQNNHLYLYEDHVPLVYLYKNDHSNDNNT